MTESSKNGGKTHSRGKFRGKCEDDEGGSLQYLQSKIFLTAKEMRDVYREPQTEIVEDPDTKVKETKKKYGLLPMMAHSSVGRIGALNASSFCERINSCAKDVVSDLHTCLSDESIEKMVLLKMNGKFMNYMWTHHKTGFARSRVNLEYETVEKK